MRVSAHVVCPRFLASRALSGPTMFGRRGVFADQFRCHSVSLLAAEQQRDADRLEYSDKIILPPSCLEKLAHLEVSYPMMFEITNPRYLARRLHCGVLEFIAQEGMVYLPFWMMENMHLSEGDVIHLRSASIPQGVIREASATNDRLHPHLESKGCAGAVARQLFRPHEGRNIPDPLQQEEVRHRCGGGAP